MFPLIGTFFILLVVVIWASLGCYSLREFAYSRLEQLCEERSHPERFRSILTLQDPATLVLEVLVTAGTVGLGICLGGILGGPEIWQPVPVLLVAAEYLGAFAALWLLVDLIPWVLSQVLSERFLDRNWPAIAWLLFVFQPLLGVIRGVDRFAHRISGRGEPEDDDAAVIDEEIRTVVDEGRREGVIRSEAGAMIERVMELQDEDVGAIMTPRTDMLCIEVDASLEEARQQLLEAGHSRMPIIGESTDEILGILYAKDLLKAIQPQRNPGDPMPVLRDFIRDPVYVPVTTQIPALLELLKKKHVQIAIVSDEYGGVAGLVTMEDILEEIVGEIEDEYDEDIIRQHMTLISENVAEVDARVHLDDLNARFRYQLPESEEFDTIGGFLFSLAGRVPIVGEVLEYEQLRFTVLAADHRRLTRVRIEHAEPPSVTTGPAGDR